MGQAWQARRGLQIDWLTKGLPSGTELESGEIRESAAGYLAKSVPLSREASFSLPKHPPPATRLLSARVEV